MISSRILRVLMLLVAASAQLPQQAWARTPEGQACVQTLVYQRRPYPIDLNHRFPMSHSQGEDGTCYAHALLSGVSAIQQQDLKKDSSLYGGRNAFVREFDYSPELTLLLLTLIDDEYARERVESAREFRKTRIFDGGYPAKTYARIKLYPQVLISVPNDLKLSFWSSLRTAVRSAFEKVTDLGAGTTVEEVRERIRSVLP
ncbi:MAG: hypothetical protein KGQ59_05605, partial [Bdellovibrionales bacterium]|nr:hypothetical protein [Bdellovibrionales bacterium]